MSDFGLEGRGDRVGEPSHNRYGLSPCTCPNCTEREAKVMAEANERRVGRIANANDAWYNASRFITGGSR